MYGLTQFRVSVSALDVDRTFDEKFVMNFIKDGKSLDGTIFNGTEINFLMNYHANIGLGGYVGFIDFFPHHASFLNYQSYKNRQLNVTKIFVNSMPAFRKFIGWPKNKIRPEATRFIRPVE